LQVYIRQRQTPIRERSSARVSVSLERNRCRFERSEARGVTVAPLKGSGNKNSIQERLTIVLGDDAEVVTGFYEFTSMQDGKPLARPSRFTMLVTRRVGAWLIAHHHSSLHVEPKS